MKKAILFAMVLLLLVVCMAGIGLGEDMESPVEDVGTAWERTVEKLPIIAVGALVVMGVGMLILKGKMRTAVPQRGAANYVRTNSLKITRSEDVLLYRTQKRRPRSTTASSPKAGGSAPSSSKAGTSAASGGAKQGRTNTRA